VLHANNHAFFWNTYDSNYKNRYANSAISSKDMFINEFHWDERMNLYYLKPGVFKDWGLRLGGQATVSANIRRNYDLTRFFGGDHKKITPTRMALT
jgi:hypothetical protein